MSLSTILLIVLVLMLVGSLPRWGYAKNWGYGPGFIVVVLIILLFTGII